MAIGLVVALAGPVSAARAQNLVADPVVLHLRAIQSPDGRWQATPPRTIRLDRTDTAAVPWRAEATVPWLTITPASGAGPGRLKVQLEASRLVGSPAVGEVIIAVNGAPSQRVTVHASLAATDNPPMGFIDAPADGDVPTGPVRLFGWALDDVGLSSIEVCRVGDAIPGEERCADGKGARVAQADLHVNARPDVAAAVPGFDHEGDTGWTAVVSVPAGARSPDGVLSYYALARDVTGQVASLGTKHYRPTSAPVQWAEVLELPALLLLAFVVFAVFHLWARRWLPVHLSQSPAEEQVPQPGPRWMELTALAGIMAAFAWMVIPGLSRSLEYDEMYSASQFIVDRSWWESATRVQTSNNHFGNSILASLAVRVLGPHEWAIRLPAFALALGALIVTWRFGRRLAGPAAGLCAAALLAASPAFMVWAQTARGYSGLACMAWLSVDALFRVLRTGSARQARVHTISTAVLPLFHLFGFFILAIQYVAFWLWALAARRAASPPGSTDGLGRLHRSFLAIGVATLLMFLPSVTDLVSDLPVFAVSHEPAAANAGATAAATAGTVARTTRMTVGVQWSGFADELLSIRSWNLMAIAGVLLLIGLLTLPRGEAAFGLATLGLPLLTLWLAGEAVTVYPRFFSFWLPMLAIFLAAGILAPFQWQRRSTNRVQKAVGMVTGIATVTGGLWVAQTWLDWDPPVSPADYRTWLTPSADWADSPVAAVGQDAFMFDFYLGKPLPLVVDPAQMDGLLRQHDRLLVAYHALPRMRPADVLVRNLLARRCLDRANVNIVLFECR